MNLKHRTEQEDCIIVTGFDISFEWASGVCTLDNVFFTDKA
jgi:hypothetical protein